MKYNKKPRNKIRNRPQHREIPCCAEGTARDPMTPANARIAALATGVSLAGLDARATEARGGLTGHPFWRMRSIPIELREIGAEFGGVVESIAAHGFGASPIAGAQGGGPPDGIEWRRAALLDLHNAAKTAIEERPLALTVQRRGRRANRRDLKTYHLVLMLTVGGLSVVEIVGRFGWSKAHAAGRATDAFRFALQRVALAWGRDEAAMSAPGYENHS